jgi:hypothetical protein
MGSGNHLQDRLDNEEDERCPDCLRIKCRCQQIEDRMGDK